MCEFINSPAAGPVCRDDAIVSLFPYFILVLAEILEQLAENHFVQFVRLNFHVKNMNDYNVAELWFCNYIKKPNFSI